MQDQKTSILIVEDDESVRTSLTQVFTVIGYRARCAEDGLAALAAMREEVPEVLLSDLNMPRMSGYELLSVVRRRFPAVRVVAMSGLFSGSEIPCGVIADAFYQKGSGMPALLRVMEGWPQPTREESRTRDPIWIQRNGHDASGGEFVTIACPDCFRTFPQAIDGTANLILDTSCVFCKGSIVYAIVDPIGLSMPKCFEPKPRLAKTLAPAGLTAA
jgi:CheY-like chemotaxis protein